MKKAILIVGMILFAATSLSAVTIDTAAVNSTACNRPKSISKTFGKLPASKEYGIFLKITCRAERGESERSSLFYRLKSTIIEDGKSLYTVVDGTKIMLAEKKWLGWAVADGVTIMHSRERAPRPTYIVWVEAEQF